MGAMNSAAPRLKHVITVLLTLTLALFARAWLQLLLQDSGIERRVASDIAFLIVPPVLLLLLPVLREDRSLLANLFCRRDLSLKIVVGAVAIGLLIRTAWWAQLIARVSFGWQQNQSPQVFQGPAISLQCPEPQLLLLGIFTTVVLIPVIEETAHRGYVQAYLHSRGPVVSVLAASAIFMVFHLYEGWLFAFAGGLVLGALYWVTGSLWASVICHAVVNLTPQLVWRCLNPSWNPDPQFLPLWTPGILGLLTFAMSGLAIARLTLALAGRRGT